MFRLCHFSDLHIGSEAGVLNKTDAGDDVIGNIADTETASSPSQDGLKHSVLRMTSHCKASLMYGAKFAYRHSHRIDAMIVSGDLAKNGREKNLSVARNHLNEEATVRYYYKLRKPTFNFDKTPIFLMPGNHDRYVGALPLADGSSFDKEFSAIYTVRNRVYSKTLGKLGETLSLIFTDFTFRSSLDANNPFHLLGGGCAYLDVLEEFESEVRRVRTAHPNTTVVWVQHFFPHETTIPALSLTGYENVKLLAKKLRIRLILCGHTHEKSTYVDDELVIYCAGSISCIANQKKNFVHMIEINKIGAKVEFLRTNYVSRDIDSFKKDSNEMHSISV